MISHEIILSGDGWIEPIAKLGTCFNFHIMYEDLIFTVEPGHIKVTRLVLLSGMAPVLILPIADHPGV